MPRREGLWRGIDGAFMKILFIASLTCAVCSLLGMIAISLITFAGGPEVESTRSTLMAVAGVSSTFWFAVTLYIQFRWKKAVPAASPSWWLQGLFVLAAAVYILIILAVV